MITLYEDDLYPPELINWRSKKYEGKTIREVIDSHPNPRLFIKMFNSLNNKYGLSDEVAVDTFKAKLFLRK